MKSQQAHLNRTVFNTAISANVAVLKNHCQQHTDIKKALKTKRYN